MNRRSFLKLSLRAAAAGMVLDPEELLWVPRSMITVPERVITLPACAGSTFTLAAADKVLKAFYTPMVREQLNNSSFLLKNFLDTP